MNRIITNKQAGMNLVEVQHVSRWEEGRYIIKDLSFTQQPLEKIAIAGANGSGKSTLLKMIAGLVQPANGNILFEGIHVKGPEETLLPGHSAIAYLSQHFELRNYYRVEELLAMANKLTDEEAFSIYETCRISHLVKRWTHQLSGGEKQRIALARLLVAAPRLLLLDEPYSNLDAIHKNILKEVISDVCKNLDISCILVSHNPKDALSWADKIIVLNDGQLIQQGPPEEVYKHPVNEYTAALFGKYTVLSPALAAAFSAFADIEINTINSFVRPENFKLVKPGAGILCEVTKQSFMRSYYEAEVLYSGNKIIIDTGTQKIAEGDTVYVGLDSD
jgi:ABC-type Fe3+/spermidine/putrescine transport system ATPase subunit